jgi:hybrid cluster-associated redox disulfide protein
MTVDRLLGLHPQAAQVFIRHGMACVGCFISGFHTLAEVAAIYGIEEQSFLDELHHGIQRIERSINEEEADADSNPMDD